MTPPRTRLKRTNSVTDFSDGGTSDGGVSRKRKHEPDVTVLMNEVNILNIFKAVDDLKFVNKN